MPKIVYRFNPGDFVRLRNGKTKMLVLDAKARSNSRAFQMIRAQYVNNAGRYREYAKWRDAYDFVPWDGDKEPEERGEWDESLNRFHTGEDYKTENEDMTAKLYQTTDKTPRFGTYLAKNSEGQIVLEMKGEAGKVEAFDPKAIEEVVPYTIRVRGVSDDHYTCHYSIEKGKVELHDLIASKSGNLYVVVELDTKNKNPKGEFKGRVFTACDTIG